MPIQVVITDDHPVVRSGYRRLLSLEPDISVIAECETGEDAYLWFCQHQADVLVLDLSMPGRGGLDALRRIRLRCPQLAVLVFSMHDNAAMVQQVLASGATGYVSKRSAPEELCDAIRAVAAGRRHLSPDIQVLVAQEPAEQPPHTQLSQREFIIFQHLALGLSVKQLAEDFHLSPKTIYNHQTQIYRKLSIDNAAQLMQYALQHGLLASKH